MEISGKVTTFVSHKVYKELVMTTERHQFIVKAISQKAREIAPKGSQVILFGSQARGDARDSSDWDVLVLLDKEHITPQDLDEYSYPFWEMGLDYNESINAILYTLKDWKHDSASPFVRNVNKEGIRLWG